MTDPEYDAFMDALAREWVVPKLNASAGITTELIQSFVALRIAQVLAQVAVGDELRHLGPDDRAWFKAKGEEVVKDSITRIDVMLMEAAAAAKAADAHS